MIEVMQKFRQMTPYERRIILLLGISALTNCFSTFLQMVTNYSPKYHCDYVQELESAHPHVYEKVTCSLEKKNIDCHKVFLWMASVIHSDIYEVCSSWYSYMLYLNLMIWLLS